MEYITGFFEYLVPFLIVLTLVVFAHEFGHFIVARLCGVRVEEFSIGFGRELAGRLSKAGTRWKLSAVPIGGYVKMFGDEDPASATTDEAREFTEEEKAVAFFAQSRIKRALVVVAGPIFNFIFAVVIFVVLFSVFGQVLFQPVIGEVMAETAAAEAGLKAGDEILEIDGEPIRYFQALQDHVLMYPGEEMDLKIRRGEETLFLSVTPRLIQDEARFGSPEKRPFLGVRSESGEEYRTFKKMPLHRAVVESVSSSWDIASRTLLALWQIVRGSRSSDELGGPIRIAEFSGDAAKKGVAGYLSFIAMLSVNLGLINLFPIPLLDGGHLAIYGMEGAMRRPLSDRAREISLKIGLFLVLALLIFATWNDICRIVERFVF